jgi:hypothetical protein
MEGGIQRRITPEPVAKEQERSDHVDTEGDAVPKPPQHIYCDMARNCLFYRKKLQDWEDDAASQQGSSSRKPHTQGRQYRVATAVQKYADCFLDCGHLCCTMIPPGIRLHSPDERLTSCAVTHAQHCTATGCRKLDEYTRQLKDAGRWKRVKQHPSQLKDDALRVSSVLRLYKFRITSHVLHLTRIVLCLTVLYYGYTSSVLRLTGLTMH